MPGDPRIYTPRIRDILPQRLPGPSSEAIDPIAKVFAWHLRAILVQQEPSFQIYKKELALPDTLNVLPLAKTVQYPANAINADEGQNDGNWQVLESLLTQSSVPTERLEESVVLVHGDLATKERIDALRKMRSIEHSAKNRLDFVVFVPGLFHLKMAATDAFWRIHVEPLAGRDDTVGFFQYIHHLRAKETGKFASEPGFRRLHDAIHHSMWTDVLDCWRIEARSIGHANLKDYARAKPDWQAIVSMSESMVQTYLPQPNFGYTRTQEEADRDKVFENVALRKQHGLLYLELSHAMNHGDVGRILRLWPYWIAIFKSTGKSKYTAHMIRFITDLEHVFPPRLRSFVIF